MMPEPTREQVARAVERVSRGCRSCGLPHVQAFTSAAGKPLAVCPRGHIDQAPETYAADVVIRALDDGPAHAPGFAASDFAGDDTEAQP